MEPDFIQREYADKYKDYLETGDTTGLTKMDLKDIEAELDETRKFYNLKELVCLFIGPKYRGKRTFTFKGIRK